MDRYPPAYPPPLPTSTAVDPGGVVVADLHCRRCQYNLRTLSVASRCPECGLAVGFSAQGDLLRFSDPNWVLTLRRGALGILWGVAVLVLGVILTVAVDRFEGDDRDISGVVSAVAGLAGNVLLLVGGWLLTTPDPSGLGEDRYGTSRKLIRVTLLFGAGGQFLELIDEGFVMPPSMRTAFRILTALAVLAGLVGTFAELQYIGKLAARIPDEHIVKRANFLKWAFVVSIGLFFVGGFCLALLAAGGGAWGVICVAVVALLAFLVLAVMYVLMLLRLAAELKGQARHAIETWAAGSPAPTQ